MYDLYLRIDYANLRYTFAIGVKEAIVGWMKIKVDKRNHGQNEWWFATLP